MNHSSTSTLIKNTVFFFMTMLLTMYPIDIQQPSHSSVSGSRQNGSRYGGTLVWGTVNPPTIINPALTSYSVSASLLNLIFDSLVHLDSNGKIVPGLAY